MPIVTRRRFAALPQLAAAVVLASSGSVSSVRACPPGAGGGMTDPWGGPVVSRVDSCGEPVIQLAILLDTSGSMEGLINQARARIWDVVNDLSKARRDGTRARLEVALYQYGSGRLPSSEGFLTLVQPFTTDLDLLSERLFGLSVGGSSEYCGWVMQSAARELSWDSTPASVPLRRQPLRVMVIAGNEPFTQGPVSYRGAADCARQRGVIVDTVYCGPYSEGEQTGWYDAACTGCGAYLSIDKDAPCEQVRCPQDDEMLRLNTRLNATYLAYGTDGARFAARQEAQDAANSALSREAGVSRAAAKAGAQYSNAHWDVVDAVEQGRLDLASAPTETLPGSLRGLTVEERKREVESLKKERDGLRERIRGLAAERERYIRDHRDGRPGGQTLDAAMIRALREQARRLGFVFEPD